MWERESLLQRDLISLLPSIIGGVPEAIQLVTTNKREMRRTRTNEESRVGGGGEGMYGGWEEYEIDAKSIVPFACLLARCLFARTVHAFTYSALLASLERSAALIHLLTHLLLSS